MSDQADVRRTYDTVAEAYAGYFTDTAWEDPFDLAALDHLIEVCRSSSAHPARPHVLDAGCGAGRMGRYLVDRGCEVTGVDLSPGMVAMARRDHPDIPTAVASITDLPFTDGCFDAVLSWYSTIHLPDDDLPMAATEMARVLRPGGHALVAFQTGDGVREVGEGFRERGYDVELLRYHRSAEQVAEVLVAAGLTEVSSKVREAAEKERDGQAFLLFQA